MTSPSGGPPAGCPTCGARVTPDLRFCLDCGTSLAPAACPSCGTPRVAGARFCGQCGARLEDAAEPAVRVAQAAGRSWPTTATHVSGPRGTERRLVSILFADLVGFTARSEAEDPEAVREFLSAYFDRTSEIVGRYGGTIEKFIGDAVMAAWGTPTAHEDDAERAVRAALDVVAGVAGLEADLLVRAAVTTGEAAVDLSARGQALVAGDLVNTAARLQAAAPAGGVLVDETTRLAAGRAIAFDASGELELKGKSDPVRTWTALRVVAERGGIGRREGLEPPFVGRHEELRLLKDSLHATAREGKARLVTIIGHAGYGKSRLGWELKKYTDGLAETIYWHEGETPAYGEGVAYWALGGMVRWRSHIDDGDSAAVAREKLAHTVAEFVPDTDDRAWIEPRLAALLGLADVPAGDREELFAAWRTFFEHIARRGTVTLIFEDLHWADEALLDFIDHLLEWSRDHAILVVGLARPELLSRRPGWGSMHRSATTVHLDPLSDDALGDLLRGLVPGLPEPSLAEVVSRAEGVPLYAVEIIRMLLDGGQLVREGERYRLLDPTATIAVPASLQALVSARLDALGPGERSLVQDAAVLGKSFSRQALAAVSAQGPEELDARLEQLVNKEIVTLDRGSHAAGERHQYEFVQSLLRDVAYATLSRRDRRDRHMKAAEHFEALGDEELAGIVATHLLDAYQSMPDGAEGQAAADRARVALRSAAERSIALHANHAAITFIEQALTVTQDPAERARLWVMATEPAQAVLTAEESERYIRRAMDWYLANGYDDEADEAVAIMAAWAIHTSRVDEIRALLESRVARIDDRRAGPTAPRLLNELARTHLITSDPDDAIEPLDRGVRIAERLMLEPELAELLATKSWAVGLQGRNRESMLFAQAALELAQQHEMVATELRARMNLSDLLTSLDPRRGFEVATDGVALAERVGHASWAAALAGNEGSAALLLGEWQRPLERLSLARPNIVGFGLLSIVSMAAIAAAYRGEPPPDGWGLPEIIDGVPQGETALMAFEAWHGFASGELQDVDRLALDSAKGGSTHIGETMFASCMAVHALIWLGSRNRLSDFLTSFVEQPWNSYFKTRTINHARNALAALDGRYEEAEAGYRASIEMWRRLEMRPHVAIAQMEMLRLFGERLPDRVALAAEARGALDDLGAVTLMARLDDVAPADPVTATA